MILFILQNAYTSEKHPFSNHEEWHRELLRSHTGRRLMEMIPDGKEFCVINSSPVIGNNPDSIFPADINYIKDWIRVVNPRVICACGQTAQDACKKLDITFISAPHPAWRALSKEITMCVKNNILMKLL